ncbi:hypothetical protein A6R68_05775, partial [Neotoma lepida]
SQRAGPSPRPSRRAPELSSLAAAAPRRSSGSLPARRRRQRRPRCCCSCGVAAQPGGAEGRARGWASAWLRRPGESRQVTPSLAPGPLPGALGAGRCGRGARGSGRGAAPAPGGSPTRGSCCLNAGALPSRRLPRPAQPRPPGAPVPFVPGRCSLPRERRDWSARTEPPSRTRSAAARLTAEAPGRVKCVLSTRNVCRGFLGVRVTPTPTPEQSFNPKGSSWGSHCLEHLSNRRGFSGVTGPQPDATAPAARVP